MKKSSIFLSICVFFMTAGHMAFASHPGTTYGFSPKGIALGNAMTAHVNDWSSVYYNIAGLGRTAHISRDQSKNELFLGYLHTIPNLSIDFSAHPDEPGLTERWEKENAGSAPVVRETVGTDNLDFGAFVIGTALDLNSIYQMPADISSARFGIGIISMSDMSVANIHDIDARTHNFLRYGKEIQRLTMIMGAGFGIMNDALGFGFGVNSAFGGEGAVILEQVQLTEDQQSPVTQTQMKLTMEATSFTLGTYADLSKFFPQLKGVNVGLTYQMESYTEIYPFDNAAATSLGNIEMNLLMSIFDYYQPNTIIAGISFPIPISDRLIFSFDLEYQQWSNFESSYSYSFLSNLEKLSMTAPELEDIIIPRLGVQYIPSDTVTVYFGAYMQPSFIPDDVINSGINWLDNDKFVLSVGSKIILPRMPRVKIPMELNIAYQFQYHDQRSTQKINYDTDDDATNNLDPNYEFYGSCHTIMAGISF